MVDDRMSEWLFPNLLHVTDLVDVRDTMLNSANGFIVGDVLRMVQAYLLEPQLLHWREEELATEGQTGDLSPWMGVLAATRIVTVVDPLHVEVTVRFVKNVPQSKEDSAVVSLMMGSGVKALHLRNDYAWSTCSYDLTCHPGDCSLGCREALRKVSTLNRDIGALVHPSDTFDYMCRKMDEVRSDVRAWWRDYIWHQPSVRAVRLYRKPLSVHVASSSTANTSHPLRQSKNLGYQPARKTE